MTASSERLLLSPVGLTVISDKHPQLLPVTKNHHHRKAPTIGNIFLVAFWADGTLNAIAFIVLKMPGKRA